MSLWRRAWSRLRHSLSTSPAAAARDCRLSETVSLDDPAVSADPFGWYEALRSEGGGILFLPRHDAWLVLNDEVAREILSNSTDYSSAPWSFIDPVMLGADPPAHGPVRRIVSRLFSGERIRRLEEMARASCARLVAPELDAVGGYARPVSRQVAAALIGFGSPAVDALAECEGDPFEAGSFDSLFRALDAVAESSSAYSQLLTDGAGMIGPAEARSLVRLLWVASTATTERAIARSVLRLAEDDRLQDRLRTEPVLVPRFVDEMVRLFPPEMILRRQATRSVTLAGAAIQQGAQILVCLPAANRDPAVHGAPGEMDLARESPSIAFGSGAHTCIGGPLSRRIVAAATETLLERSRSFGLAVPSADLPFMHSMVVIAPRTLPVRLQMMD